MKVLIACEFSQVVTKAFRNKGHDAFSCDILTTDGDPKYHLQGDVLDYLQEGRWDLMIAHPPCTYLCISGNSWFYHPEDKHLPVSERRPHPKFPNRRQHQADALDFVKTLLNAPIDKICLENPVGKISTVVRKPDQIIQPFQFGHPEPKKTCLWLKNLSKLEPTKLVEPEYSVYGGKKHATWYYAPSNTPERQKMRETTFQGIANAMADQWG